MTAVKLPALDLFGLVQQPPKRTNDRPEAAALAEVLKAFVAHDLRDVVRELGPVHGVHPLGP